MLAAMFCRWSSQLLECETRLSARAFRLAPTPFNVSLHKSSRTKRRPNLNCAVHAQHSSGILGASTCGKQGIFVIEFKSFAHSFKVRIVNKVHEIKYLADQKIE